MKKSLPLLFDRPEKNMSVAALCYGVLCFWSFPFLMLFSAQGFTDPADLSWFELVYHAFNFGVAVWIFRDYLKDSFWNVKCDVKKIIKITAICVGIMVVYSLAMWVLNFIRLPYQFYSAANGTLPVVEMELFNLTSYLIQVNPVFGTICVVILAPVSVSCLYYGATFAPFCSERPWLAYIMITVMLAIPRICNALTFWPLGEELALYLAQLPLHWIACAAYHKADTIWAPIIVHMTANLLSCITIFLMY